MKKTILLLITIIGYTTIIFDCYYSNKDIDKDNKKLYADFKKNNLIDVDGKINLTEVKTQHDSLESDLEKLYTKKYKTKEEYQNIINEKNNTNKSLKEKTVELNNQISTLQNKEKELTNQYNILKNKYNNLKQQQVKSSTTNKYNFPLINQYPKYPTGCESVALTMLLRYYGINVTPDNVISNLNKESLPYLENNVKYGGNPEVGFIGNPYSSSSYGVYERPIANVANMYKSGIQIKNNYPFQEVINLAKQNHPVLVWTSMSLSLPYISNNWVYKPTMETIYWKANEHAVVVIGYEGNNIIIADPIGGAIKSYSASVFESRYNYYGRRALYYL